MNNRLFAPRAFPAWKPVYSDKATQCSIRESESFFRLRTGKKFFPLRSAFMVSYSFATLAETGAGLTPSDLTRPPACDLWVFFRNIYVRLHRRTVTAPPSQSNPVVGIQSTRPIRSEVGTMNFAGKAHRYSGRCYEPNTERKMVGNPVMGFSGQKISVESASLVISAIQNMGALKLIAVLEYRQ